jgi:hypothetical protein
MSHRGDPVQREPKPPRKRLDPVKPLIIGAVLTALALLAVFLYYHH